MRTWILPVTATFLFFQLGCGDETLAPSLAETGTWTWHQAYPGEDLLGVGGGSQGFFAGGRDRAGRRSVDGLTWMSRSSNTHDIRDVVEVPGAWVTVGAQGSISRILLNSHLVYSDPTFDLDAVAGSGNLLVAVGGRGPDDGVALSSGDDGQTWSAPVHVSAPMHDVLWDGNRFVAVGNNGRVALTTDGTSWQYATVPGAGHLVAVAFGDRGYAALDGTGKVFSATNPNDWEQAGMLLGEPRALTFAHGHYVAAGAKGRIWRSLEARNWHSVTTPIDSDLNGIAHDGEILVAVGDDGVVLRSRDGRTWRREFGGLPSEFTKALWTGERFLVTDVWGTFLSSTDGVVWESQDAGAAGLLEGIVKFPGGYLAFNWNGGKTWLSADGVSWEPRASDHPSTSISDAVWFQDRFIAVGRIGMIHESNDGVTWSQLPAFTEQSLWSAATGAGKVVVGGANTLFVSEDLETWESLPYPDTYPLKWTEAGFLGISNGVLIHSEDGRTWTSHIVPGVRAAGFTTDGTRTYVTGLDGVIASSTDMVNWGLEESGTTNALHDGAASPDRVLVVGRSGMLLVKERAAF